MIANARETRTQETKKPVKETTISAQNTTTSTNEVIGQDDYLMVMLAHVDAPIWVKLPKAIQQLIIRE